MVDGEFWKAPHKYARMMNAVTWIPIAWQKRNQVIIAWWTSSTIYLTKLFWGIMSNTPSYCKYCGFYQKLKSKIFCQEAFNTLCFVKERFTLLGRYSVYKKPHLLKCSSRHSLQNLWPHLVRTISLRVNWHITQRNSSSTAFTVFVITWR